MFNVKNIAREPVEMYANMFE